MTFLPRRVLALALLALVAVVAATVVPAGVVSAMETAPADSVGAAGGVCGEVASARYGPDGRSGRGSGPVFGLVGSAETSLSAAAGGGVACCYTYANGDAMMFSDPTGYRAHNELFDGLKTGLGVTKDASTGALGWCGDFLGDIGNAFQELQDLVNACSETTTSWAASCGVAFDEVEDGDNTVFNTCEGVGQTAAPILQDPASLYRDPLNVAEALVDEGPGAAWDHTFAAYLKPVADIVSCLGGPTRPPATDV